jgi:subtilisin-like proprotein convertase family protein
MIKFFSLLFAVVMMATVANAQDVPVSVGPAPVSDIKVTPQEPTPFAVGTRAFTQISSSPTFQFGKSFLESCTITNIGAPFTITFPGGLVYRNGIVYTWNQSSPFQLWSIDTVTGTHTLVFNMTGVPQANFTGMTWDGTTMYGVSTSITQSQLFSINMTTGACTPIGTASSVCAGAILLAGRIGVANGLFVADIVADNLYRVNKTTGVFTLIGPLGGNANFGQDGQFDPNDGKLYWMSYTTGPQLRVLDTATGTAGPVLCTYSNQACGIAPVPSVAPPPPGVVTTICKNGLALNIPDNATVYDTLTHIGNGGCQILDVNVKIDTIIHTWVSDMSIALKRGAAGTPVALITNRGGSGDNIIGCTLNDSAANPISGATAPFTGSWRPEQPLTAFNTLSPQGAWILSINDNATGDTGTLRAWCITWFYTCPTGGVQQVEIPFTYRLSQNYPNPFNPTTTIKYGLPKYGNTKLSVYDITGKLVKVLVNEFKDSGTYEVTFDASSYSSGVYFYTLESGNYKETKKMLLVK